MKKLIALTAFFSNFVLANACIPDHCAEVYIDKLYVESSGTIYIGTSGDESKLNCHAESGVYVTIPAGTPGADFLYSTLLSAQTTGRAVSVIQVDDHKPGCVVQYVTLDRVRD